MAGPAMAQQFPKQYRIPTTERCATYQDRFDKRVTAKRGHPNMPQAVYWRRWGERFCNTGRTADGQAALRKALTLLGVNPEGK